MVDTDALATTVPAVSLLSVLISALLSSGNCHARDVPPECPFAWEYELRWTDTFWVYLFPTRKLKCIQQCLPSDLSLLTLHTPIASFLLFKLNLLRDLSLFGLFAQSDISEEKKRTSFLSLLEDCTCYSTAWMWILPCCLSFTLFVSFLIFELVAPLLMYVCVFAISFGDELEYC